jgi:PadR family transcriptional regulator PadR
MMDAQPRMTLQTLKVLKVLLDHPTMQQYGLEISKRTGLAVGSLYPILGRLERAGWLESEWELSDVHAEGRPRRRYYRLTSEGAERARQAVQDIGEAILPAPEPQNRNRIRRPQPGEMPI